MYLKSIEINGFKSFANKIEFQFQKGITGIVGPNGSGKSNIADAVRWVLGEQSASKLRGSRMEDVIFSGTETRKPQGAAYVAITLDNSDHSLPVDYTEVTVARRVYRTGESEYLLNGTVTRLKDVTALFLDTGIGKEGYSIIGQGQIERILSDKPDDRRALFDEAAGIVKYKKNKQVTEKQLEEEHANLNRVNDILSGLEERREPLEKQAAKAKEYLSLKERLKTCELHQFLMETDELKAKIRHTKDQRESTETSLAEKKRTFEETRTEYEKLENELEELQRETDERKNAVNEKSLENERSEGEIRVFQERSASGDREKEELIRQINRLKEELAAAESERKNKESEEQQIQQTYQAEQEKIHSIQAELTDILHQEKNAEERIQQANDDILQTVNESSSLKAKAARYDAMLENIELKKHELNARFLQNTGSREKLTEEKKTLQTSQESVQEALNQRRKSLERCEEDLRSTGNQAASLQTEIDSCGREIIRLTSRYENLRNLAERYEGYGSAIRKVMEQKSTHPGIVGVVADILKVDQKYETAIETALGGSIQNIVTDDEKTAKDMIAYLRNNRLGRATFLPISTVRGHGSVRPEVLREKGVIGTASSLVSTDMAFRDLVESLLGRTVVVENLDAAITIARHQRQSVRLVTPAGDLINPGGAMTGGAFRNSSNLLGRKRELDEIEKEKKAKNAALQKAREEKTSLDMKRSSLKETREKLTREIQNLSIEESKVRISLQNHAQNEKKLQEDLQSIQKENQELEEQISSIHQNKAEIEQTGKEHETSLSDRKNQMEELNQQLQKIRASRQEKEKQEKEEELVISRLQQKLDFSRSEKERIRKDWEEKDRRQKNLEEQSRKNQTDRKNVLKQLDETRQKIRENQKQIEAEEKALEKLKQRQSEIMESHKSFLDQRDQLSGEISGLEKADLTLGMTLEKLEEDRDEKSSYMWETYELTYSGAEKLRDPAITSLPDIKRESSDLKKKIRQLGDVNVGAVEEYEEVSKRYDFLKAQKDDITQAEENLKTIIQDLDESMKKTFSEKFREIRHMFSTVFRELFGGGKADLILVDENDLLETGIIINAEPPGKKLQNIMQLSGGEKSLTAISLLFAIQSLKPSPFCILDEIEAALDDSNVDRFARYLHKLTDHTQFIVITHRRGTMEAADVLYGITMQEKGISTLVSVSLIEDKLSD